MRTCRVFAQTVTYGKNDLPIYHHMHVLTILAAAVLANHNTQKLACKSQLEIILSDLNWYMAKTLCLVIILMDDPIKYTWIWPLAI